MKKEETLTIRIEAKELDKIEEIASHFNRTKSDLVREAIDDLLADWEAYLIASNREGESTLSSGELKKRLGIKK
ncbi:ribbon-helix-helix protein, CopG family [bacterium]|nr:ribbon-helix-helix protein, CopG family [bacterium]